MKNVLQIMLICLGGIILALLIAHSVGIIDIQGYLVSEDKAIAALENQGFSKVRITARHTGFIRMRGGSKDDDVRFTAEAINPAGKSVTAYVFVGWPFKGATIRFP